MASDNGKIELDVQSFQKLIADMAASNREGLKEFAAEFARKLTHPEPTEEERQALLRRLQARIDQARIDDAGKERRRKHCVYPASPNSPHRRTGVQWMNFNGTSTIAWHYTSRTFRDDKGNPGETQPFPVGVCQWCLSVFQPEDPDYQEALTWGLSAISGTHPMDVHTGAWTS